MSIKGKPKPNECVVPLMIKILLLKFATGLQSPVFQSVYQSLIIQTQPLLLTSKTVNSRQ